MPTKIYFAECGDRIKIGISADPHKRIAALAKNIAREIKIIGTVPGTYAHERALHIALSKYRIGSEWYHDSPHLREIIGRCLLDLEATILDPEQIGNFAQHCLLAWGDDAAAKIQEIGGCDADTAARMLSGEFEPTGVIAAALIQEIFRRD